jgi:hypothetical protein
MEALCEGVTFLLDNSINSIKKKKNWKESSKKYKIHASVSNLKAKVTRTSRISNALMLIWQKQDKLTISY